MGKGIKSEINDNKLQPSNKGKVTKLKDKNGCIFSCQIPHGRPWDNEKFDNVYARFNNTCSSLKALGTTYTNKQYVRKFLRALTSKWRPKVTAIDESKDLTKLTLDEVIGNLKVHEIILEKDEEADKTKKEKTRSIALKAKASEECEYEVDDDDILNDDEQLAFIFRSFKKKNEKAFILGAWDDEENKTQEDGKEMCLMVIKASNSEDDEETCLVGQTENEVCLNGFVQEDDWTIDSGCTTHMTGNKEFFSKYKEHNGGDVIFGGDVRGKIVGKGNITNCKITLEDVLHIRNLSFNFLSVGKICDKGYNMNFTKTSSHITKDGRNIIDGIRKKGLYTCRLDKFKHVDICLTSIHDTITLWHRRLGHANMKLIHNISSKEIVRDLPKFKYDTHFCDAC
ncbi:uncharacterized protein [Rutidosis leptorrhynchoides]|uniref:uncharacterized protein n=1 Tax=Rutidosis leptorrhynchoides TaxID=125765 RepID=UPI003A9A0D89